MPGSQRLSAAHALGFPVHDARHPHHRGQHGRAGIGLVERFKLAEGLPYGLKPHRAAYDALVTVPLFVLLAGRADSLEELLGQPPGKVPEDALS